MIRKKTIILFLCVIEILSGFTIGGVKAEDGCRQKSLYAYSDENESFDEFARNNFYEMLLVQEYDFDTSTVYLGHGIRVFGSDSQSEVLYPVWQSSDIIACYVVFNDEMGNVCSCMTGYYTEALNCLASQTTSQLPLLLCKNDNGIYGVIGDEAYDLCSLSVSSVLNVKSDLESIQIIDAKQTLDFIKTPGAAKGTWITKPFTYCQTQNEPTYCLAYVTYNCLQNLGYTSYTLAQCKSPLNAFGGGNPSTMSNWLNNQGFNSYYSNSGYLTISQIDSVILNNHCYVMISASLTNTSGHAFLIYGAHSDGYIRYWDPRSTSYSTSSSPYTSLLGSDGYTYTWNHGYYYLDVEWD